ncbi:MAG: N-formylglutamate amidohydrolase [Halieaceae bacterium]|jgi:predicted N-formylglutamate amidohydrolase|nr:N-formylglutamate amidohydrolase [Halieaceae bacterium]
MAVTLSQTPPLLREHEGPAVEVINDDGNSRIVLICEHASLQFPEALGTLGLDLEARESHIAWDPGARVVADHLSQALDAPLVAARFSRLAFDCNRPPGRSGVAEQSERWTIPGNQGLDDAQIAQRVQSIYEPFHQHLAALLETRLANGPAPILVSIHSFTPVFNGERRDLELGILHDADSRLADALLPLSPAVTGLDTRRNQPYEPRDGVTHTMRTHALAQGLANVMLEIRSDLIERLDLAERVAHRLAKLLQAGLTALLKHPAS